METTPEVVLAEGYRRVAAADFTAHDLAALTADLGG